jgi:hypothetical protein
MDDGAWPYIAVLFKIVFESIAKDYDEYNKRMQDLHKTNDSFLSYYIFNILMMPFIYLYEKLWGVFT